VVIRVEFESVWFFCPDARDIFVWCEAAQGLEPAAVVIGVDEELEMLPELVVAIVMMGSTVRVR